MKKLILTIGLVVALFCAPSVTVAARAGGAVGGGGGMHMGGGTSYGGGMHMGGGRMFVGRHMLLGRGVWFGAPILAVVLVIGGWQLLKRRQNAQAAVPQKSALYPLEPQLAKAFEPLFYTIEEAWSQNDQETLAQYMTSRYFGRQKALLDRWQRAGRRNRLEDLALIDVQQEASDADHPHVVVTAQARDYFDYPERSAEFNQAQHDDAMIERFTEVWELAYAQADGRLLLAKIRQ
ncbi:MAG: TIM44-like domain-containing protein [Lactobacillus sp.]|jgi:hypothetical protein|nr:TIM44-like domain-containing protein [Lactobacillus sp.]MCI2034028.1 TIM44-like domain-containing protein [Lactobacillus sp.]